jgi:hypothetical protein
MSMAKMTPVRMLILGMTKVGMLNGPIPSRTTVQATLNLRLPVYATRMMNVVTAAMH